MTFGGQSFGSQYFLPPVAFNGSNTLLPQTGLGRFRIICSLSLVERTANRSSDPNFGKECGVFGVSALQPHPERNVSTPRSVNRFGIN